MTHTVLRITRHAMLPGQEEALRKVVSKLFGVKNPTVIVVNEAVDVKDANQIIELAEKHKATVLEVVLPPNLLMDLLNLIQTKKLDLPVIRAITERELVPNPEGGEPKAIFHFRGYERIKRLVIETEPL